MKGLIEWLNKPIHLEQVYLHCTIQLLIKLVELLDICARRQALIPTKRITYDIWTLKKKTSGSLLFTYTSLTQLLLPILNWQNYQPYLLPDAFHVCTRVLATGGRQLGSRTETLKETHQHDDHYAW